MGIGDLDYSSRDSSFLIPTSLLLIELLLEIDLGKVKVKNKFNRINRSKFKIMILVKN